MAEQRGFLGLQRGAAFHILPDYALPGVSNAALATILAGVIGVLIVFGVVAGLAVARRRSVRRGEL